MLNKLIDNPKVLYIYEVGLQIYGLFPEIKDRDFVVICENNYIPEIPNTKMDDESVTLFYDTEKEHFKFNIIFIKDWFERVLNGDLLAWECACLPKKYIHKEYVKLLLQTNPLQLRKSFDKHCKIYIPIAEKTFLEGNTLTGKKILWDLIKEVMFKFERTTDGL